MKKDLLTFVLLIFSSAFVFAQICTEQATGFGNNTTIASYNVSGDIEVVYNANEGLLTLNLGANYSTASGPDVRAYFVKSNGLSDSELTSAQIGNLEHIEFGLTSPSGAQNFTVSSPSDIAEFDKIFFYCLAFNQFWDFGTIVPFSPDGCAVTSTRDQFDANRIELIPNPATDLLSVSIGKDNVLGTVTIFNVIGQVILDRKGDISQALDISFLDSGIYHVQITYDGKLSTKKLMVSN